MTSLRKKVILNLSKVPVAQRKAAKDAVGEFIINQVLRDVERGFSPVEGEGQFDKLTKDYADKEKGGRRVANLELEGDLKEAIRFKRTKDGIEYGNFLKSQQEKADGHNQHSDKAKAWAKKNKFPKRQYIPPENKKFRSGIEREIQNIVKGFEEVPTKRVTIETQGLTTERTERTERTESGNVVRTEIATLFEDDFISAEIKRQLREG